MLVFSGASDVSPRFFKHFVDQRRHAFSDKSQWLLASNRARSASRCLYWSKTFSNGRDDGYQNETCTTESGI